MLYKEANKPLITKEQGALPLVEHFFTAPGTHDPLNPTLPHGQTIHGDHAYVQFQIPSNARELSPLLTLTLNKRSQTAVHVHPPPVPKSLFLIHFFVWIAQGRSDLISVWKLEGDLFKLGEYKNIKGDLWPPFELLIDSGINANGSYDQI